MNDSTTLTPAQRRLALQNEFINRCITTNGTLQEVLDAMQLSPLQLASWLRRRSFRSKLHHVRLFLQSARRLDLDLLARRATATLGQTSDVATRRAVIDLVKLASASDARSRATSRRQNVKPQLVHPDVDPETATELITRLDQ
jgi:hypothetical protein